MVFLAFRRKAQLGYHHFESPAKPVWDAGDMARRRWLAALIGVVAGAVAFGGYIGATYAGIHIRPELIEVAGAALAFAAAVAVFSLMVMDKPSYAGAKSPIWLNEEPATEFIFPFKSENTCAMEVTPDMSLVQIMARYQDDLSPREDKAKRAITLTLKASPKGKSFSTVTLQQLFQMMKPLSLAHVLLVDAKGRFIGYIPGKKAISEFASDKSDEKIGKYIVKLMEYPDKSSMLREINGASGDDTIAETDDSRHAEAKVWANEGVQGFVIHRHLKPVGYISKGDLLKLNARW
jgi:hypothetical protein